MAINIVTTTAGAIYLQTGVGTPTHVAPRGSQFTDTDTAKLYRNLDGQTDWQEQVSFTGASESISAFTTFHSTTSGQSDIIAEVFNDTLNFSGSNIGIYTNEVTKTMTFSASSDGSFLTNIPVSGVTNLQTNLNNLNDADVDTFIFDQGNSTITIGLNGGGSFPIDVTSLAQGIYITGGTYDSMTGNIEFSNSTGGTFVVSGFTTGITDTYINSGSFDDNTYEVDYVNNLSSGGFTLDLSDINDDITGATANLQSQIDDKTETTDFNAHTGDTSIHYEMSAITLSDLGSSAHTHTISEVNGLQTELDSLNDGITANTADFDTHTGDTSIHFTKGSILLSELGATAHTHTISEVDDLQDELDDKLDEVVFTAHTADFDTHTGDTSIHFTKGSINLDELGNTAHTHTISEVDDLQTELDSKTDNTIFDTHTGDTNIHFTKGSILLSELGATAHTHTISEVNGLQTELDSLNDGITANTANIISGVTFNENTNIISLNKNDDTSFVINLSGFSTEDVYVTGGTYNDVNEEITFTNNTGGTFTVSGITTGMTDSFVDSGSINTGSYEVTFNKNIGLGFNLDLSNIQDDIISGDTNLQNQITAHVTNGSNPHLTTFDNLVSTAHTHTISEVSGLQTELDSLNDDITANTANIDTHTGDTSIHFTKGSILLSELGATAHTHTISEIDDLQDELDDKLDEVVFTAHTADFDTHTGDTSIHFTKGSINLDELGNTAHTHTISEVDDLQTELDSKTDNTIFDTHTGDTSIHFTKGSILLSELGATAHTHTISEVDDLQTELDSLNDGITANTANIDAHTGDTSIHFTKGSILLSELGSTAHTHTISEVIGLDGELMTLNDAITGNTDNIISAVTFNNGTYMLSLDKNDASSFVADLSVLASDVYVLSGSYDPMTGNVEFTNSTAGTFTVSGFTTGMTDSFVNAGTFNDTTYDIDFTKNVGLGFSVDLSDINDDITGATSNLQSQIDTKADEVDFNSHTADTSIHYTKGTILLSELGNSGHTHPIAEVNGLQGELDSKTDITLFDSHTGDTSNPHQVTFNTLTSTAHTHTISEVNGLQTVLDDLEAGGASSGLTADFNAHTADTSIHYTKSSINLSELGSSAHTHTISEVNGLQTVLDLKTNNTTFDSHTGDTSIHFDLSDITLSNIGDSAHTHTISEVIGLDGNLMSLNDAITGNTSNLISGITFNTGSYLLSLNKNDATSFVADLSVLASDVYVLSGSYDPMTGNVEFTNSTAGTFTVSGFTTGMTDTYVDSGTFNDTTYDIDFTKNVGLGFSVDLSDINDDITGATSNLQSQIDTKADEVDFNSHTADTSIHYTKGSILLSELGSSAHTHSISEVNGLQSELNNKTNETDFSTHTGDTSIHYTKGSINLNELGDTAHTHTISEVNGLQTNLVTLNDGITANTSNIISGVTFNENTNIISFNKNDNTSFIANLSGLTSDIHVVSGLYNSNTEEITFTNNTGGTFAVSGITTGMTDSYVDAGTINVGSYEVSFTKNLGLGFTLDLSNIQNDIITGDTILQNQITSHVGDGNNPHNTTFNNLVSTAHTHTITEVNGLQTILDGKLDLTGGTIDGSLSATTYFGDGSNLTGIEFGGINIGSGATIMNISDPLVPKFKAFKSSDGTVIINESGTEINLIANVEPPSGTSAEFITFIGRNTDAVTGITNTETQIPFTNTDTNKPSVFTYNAGDLIINKAGTYQLDFSANIIGKVNNSRSNYDIYYKVNDVEPLGARSTIYGRQNNFGGEATVVSILTNVVSGDTISLFARRVVGGGTGQIDAAEARVRLMKFDNLVVDSIDWNNIVNRPDLGVSVGDLLGQWNANTNTPTITSGSHTGNTGDFYIVSTSGTTNIDGNNMWDVNDWIVWSESQFQWLKINNQTGVHSFNGLQGIVVVDTDDIPEGVNNLYMTNSEKSKLTGIEPGAEVNVQSDLGQSDSGATDYVLNKLAEHIEYDSSSVSLSSTDVQDAITELSNEKLDLTGGTLTGSLTATEFIGDGSNLTGIGEVNDGLNVGSGHGLFTGKTGSDLQFRSIVGGANITITPSATELTIESTGGGSSRIESSVQTTNAVETELEKIDTLTNNATNIVEVYVKAYQVGSGAIWGVWKRTLTVTKISGTVSIREINADVDKASASLTSASLTATSIAFNVNSGDIDLDVTGVAATTLDWESAYEIIL